MRHKSAHGTHACHMFTRAPTHGTCSEPHRQGQGTFTLASRRDRATDFKVMAANSRGGWKTICFESATRCSIFRYETVIAKLLSQRAHDGKGRRLMSFGQLFYVLRANVLGALPQPRSFFFFFAFFQWRHCKWWGRRSKSHSIGGKIAINICEESPRINKWKAARGKHMRDSRLSLVWLD